MIKDMLMMAAKQIPQEQITSVKSGIMKTLHQLAFAQKMSIKLNDDEDDVVLMFVYTDTNEIVLCPVTLSYSGGQTSIKRELVDYGFSLSRFVENLDVKEILDAVSEKNDVKQLQMVMECLTSAKNKSQISEIAEDNVEESSIKKPELGAEPNGEITSGAVGDIESE